MRWCGEMFIMAGCEELKLRDKELQEGSWAQSSRKTVNHRDVKSLRDVETCSWHSWLNLIKASFSIFLKEQNKIWIAESIVTPYGEPRQDGQNPKHRADNLLCSSSASCNKKSMKKKKICPEEKEIFVRKQRKVVSQACIMTWLSGSEGLVLLQLPLHRP